MIWGPRRQEASNFDVVYLIKKTRRGHREFFWPESRYCFGRFRADAVSGSSSLD